LNRAAFKGASVTPYGRYEQMVHLKIAESYVAGFRFHYDAVCADDELLRWVLREDYFDYRLPDNISEHDIRGRHRPPDSGGAEADKRTAS
jgi:hypothetical protein